MRRKYGRKHYSLKNNLPQLILATIFLAGIIVGSLFANQSPGDSQLGEVEKLVEGFLVNININSVPRSYLLTSALLTYGKQIVLIWLFGFFLLTLPLIGLLLAVLGFSYGFTSSFFIVQYGFKGLFIILAAYGVQGTLFVSTIFVLALESIRYAQKEKTTNFKIYTIYLVGACLIVVFLALFEAYLAPILIQQIITMFF